MIVIVDFRQLVVDGYAARFRNEGVSAVGFCPEELQEWIRSVNQDDLSSVEAILLGDCGPLNTYTSQIKSRSRLPVIALVDVHALDHTLELFDGGVDDVVRKPVHVREILARISAIRRRVQAQVDFSTVGGLKIHFDGRDPTIGGETFPLPRRERRILEYLATNTGRRVSKTQIFNAIYGIFDDNIDETVVESHISKLRKKLKTKLGYDPIDSKRHLGYCLEVDRPSRGELEMGDRRVAQRA